MPGSLRRAMRIVLLLPAVLAAGCAGIGPPTVARDRFDYVSAISDSWQRQMLLNLLKVRYADAPVFLDVTSVISSYELQGSVNLADQHAPKGRGDTFWAIGGNATYADKPTISFAPLLGDKFARSMMNPIPVQGILLLVQSGYPADFVLRICVNSINGLDNFFGGRGTVPGDPRFHELVGSSRVDLQACKLEYSIVSPK